MKRIVTTRYSIGLVGMQVCAKSDVTDQEILDHCNKDNPTGVAPWSKVVREGEPNTNQHPVPCEDYPGRTHFIVWC